MKHRSEKIADRAKLFNIIIMLRGRFKIQPAVDGPEPPVLAGGYCSGQRQPAGTGGSGRSTAG